MFKIIKINLFFFSVSWLNMWGMNPAQQSWTSPINHVVADVLNNPAQGSVRRKSDPALMLKDNESLKKIDTAYLEGTFKNRSKSVCIAPQPAKITYGFSAPLDPERELELRIAAKQRQRREKSEKNAQAQKEFLLEQQSKEKFSQDSNTDFLADEDILALRPREELSSSSSSSEVFLTKNIATVDVERGQSPFLPARDRTYSDDNDEAMRLLFYEENDTSSM